VFLYFPLDLRKLLLQLVSFNLRRGRGLSLDFEVDLVADEHLGEGVVVADGELASERTLGLLGADRFPPLGLEGSWQW